MRVRTRAHTRVHTHERAVTHERALTHTNTLMFFESYSVGESTFDLDLLQGTFFLTFCSHQSLGFDIFTGDRGTVTGSPPAMSPMIAKHCTPPCKY